MKLNKAKIQLKMPEVFYMVTHISKVIVQMPEPVNKDGVRRLIAMLNYLSPFIQNKATIISPLCALLKYGTPWLWMHEHKAATQAVKKILAEQPILRLYDPMLPMSINTS